MSTQASLADYGAAVDSDGCDGGRPRPLPEPELAMHVHGADRRALPGTGLAPSDLDPLGPWQFQTGPERFRRVATGEAPPCHPDDRDRSGRAPLGEELAIARDLARVGT